MPKPGHALGMQMISQHLLKLWVFYTVCFIQFILFPRKAEVDTYLNLLLNLQDDPCSVYHETVIMFILAMVISLLSK